MIDKICSNCGKTKKEHFRGLFHGEMVDDFCYQDILERDRFTPQKTNNNLPLSDIWDNKEDEKWNTQSQQPEVLTCQGGREFIDAEISLHLETGKPKEYLPADIRAPQTPPTLKDILNDYITGCEECNEFRICVIKDIKESLKRLRDEIRKDSRIIDKAEMVSVNCVFTQIDEIMGVFD